MKDIMKIDHDNETIDFLKLVELKIRKSNKSKNIRIANVYYDETNDNILSLIIETDSNEYIRSEMEELVAKSKFDLFHSWISDGMYDWKSDIYLKPFAAISIKKV